MPLAIAVALSIAAHDACADRIRRVDGRVIEGTLEPGWQDQTSDVRIRIGGATITVPRGQVGEIKEGSQGDNELIAAREAFAAGKLGDGIVAMDDGLRKGASAETMAQLLLVQTDAIVGSADKLGPDARGALSRVLGGLDDVRISRADDLIAARVQLHVALREFDKVDGLLEVLGTKYFSEHKDVAQRLTQRLQARIERDLADKQYEAGMETLRRLDRIDPDYGRARRTQYILEWARRLRDDKRDTEALDLYISQLIDLDPEIARDRIRVTLEETEIGLRQRGELAEAADLYEKYGMLQVPDFARDRLVRLWRDQGARRLRAGQYDDAREAYRKAESYRAGGGATELLRVDFREKFDKLGADDQLGHYELGVWCSKNGLLDEGLREFQKAKSHPVVGANAEAYIGQIKVQLADRELKRILDLHDKGQLVEALNAVQLFENSNPGEGFLAQARELDKMIREGLRMRQSDQNQQAATLFEQAQRAFYSNKYEEADQLLATIFKHYKGTVTYSKARNFHAMVRDRLTLAQLERGKSPTAKMKVDDGLTTGAPATAGEVDRIMKNLGYGDAATTATDSKQKQIEPQRRKDTKKD